MGESNLELFSFNKKEELKVNLKRYKILFEDSLISIWDGDFSKVKQYIDNLKEDGIKDIKEYFKTHPGELEKCVSIVDILDVNKATLNIYDSKTKGELLSNLKKVFIKESFETFKQGLISFIDGKTNFEGESITQTLKGKKNYIEIIWRIVQGFEGTWSRVIISINDITEKKEILETLKESKDKYQKLFDSVKDGLIISELNGKILSVNPAAVKILGYKNQKEILDLKMDNLYSYRHDRELLVNELKKRGYVKNREIRCKKKDGTFINVEVSITLDKNKDGKPLLNGMFRDITEKNKDKEALTKSKVNYKRLFDTSPNLICETDDKGNFLSVNKAFANSIGKSGEELIGKNIFDILPKKIAERRASVARKALKTDKILEDEDKREEKYFHNIYVPLTHENGKKSIQLFAEEITSEKKAIESLKENEEKYRTVVENIGEGITIFQDKKLIYANKKLAEITGYSLKELNSFCLQDIIKAVHPDDRKFMLKNIENRLSKKDILDTYHFRIITKKGDTKYLEIVSNLIEFKGKNSIVSVFTDVSERKLKEFEMKKKLMKFNIEAGNIYLVSENERISKITAINDLHKIGYKVYIISRETEEQIKTWIKGTYEYRRLAEMKTTNSITPKIETISKYIQKLPQQSVILLERIDYLITKNNFKKVLQLVQYLNEQAYLNNHIIIIAIDISILKPVEINLLLKETENIEPHSKIKISEDLVEILRFIYKYNIKGEKPSYIDVIKGLGLSKPTISTKMKELSKYGYITVFSSGRNKKSEITEKTRILLEQ